MDEKNYTGLIPEQKQGKEIIAEASLHCPDTHIARKQYDQAKQRLLHVQQWGDIAGALSTEFQVTDQQGNEAERAVEPGDYFRVDISGPGSKAGEGYDWVRVEDVKEVHLDHIDSIAIRVRPAGSPKNSNPNVAHFYSEGSTSTFVVTREDTVVTASIYDRNIEANEETQEPLDKIRNKIVGFGAKYGFSKIQWQALAKALVEKS